MELLILLLLIILLLVLIGVLLVFALFAMDIFLELPYVSTRKEKVNTIIGLANIKPGETVVDLGSGDGRLLFAAAKKGATAIGYEVNPLLVIFTIIKARFFHPRGVQSRDHVHPGGVQIKKQNLWKADLKKADVVFVYGRKKTMQRFEDFVYKNAQKGARLTVNTNPFPTKKPIKSENGIYLYRV